VRIEFTYARSPDHYAGHPSVTARPPSSVPGYLIGAVLVLAGAASTVAAAVTRTAPAASCGGFALLLGGAIAVAARQRVKSRFVMPAEAMELRRWVLTDDGIEIEGPSSSSSVTWPALHYGLELPHTYLFVLRDQCDRRTFDIPRRPLTAADDEAVREVAARHGIPFPTRPAVG
jgi:hypothetical protein